MSAFNIEIENGKSVKLPTAGKYCDRDIVVTAAEGDDRYDDGYADGKQAEYDRLVDPTKIIEQYVSGSVIRVDDVSEIPHKCIVSANKDTSVWVGGKNLAQHERLSCTVYEGNGTASSGVTLQELCPGIRLNEPFVFTADVNNDGLRKFRLRYTDANGTQIYFTDYNLDAPIIFTQETDLQCEFRLFANTGISGERKVVFSNISVTHGEKAEVYEPYCGTTHPITAGQTIEVDSICPTMTVTADNDANITFGYHKSWGMQTEYDRFWDAYQDNGNRTNYDNAFAGYGWTADNFKPKYRMQPTTAYMMFRYNQAQVDLAALLEAQGITLDLSKATQINALFFHSKFTRLPAMVFPALAASDGEFAYCRDLKTIDSLDVSAVERFSSTFYRCDALENITFVGEIKASISFSNSSKLTKVSIESIVNALSDTATGQTLTLSEAAVNTAFGDEGQDGMDTSEWGELCDTKPNWTITLV